MVMIANLQYGWTFFVYQDIQKTLRLGPFCDPMGIYPIRSVRDLARTRRGLVRRQIRPTSRGGLRRIALRHRLGDQLLRPPLFGGFYLGQIIAGIGAGARLRYLRGQRPQMVPAISAALAAGITGGRLRRRLGTNRWPRSSG